MKIEVGPTGSTVQGDVLDVNVQTLERYVKEIDSQLYFKWNPKKLLGYGTWELRRKPAAKSIIEKVTYKGETYCLLDYKENNWENHIWDLPRLDYSLLDRLRAADQWSQSNYDPDRPIRLSRHNQAMINREFEVKDEAKAKARADMVYQLLQDKALIKRFKDDVKSGANPANIARHWNKA